MIVEGLLAVVFGVVNTLLLPLEILNFGFDILSSITFISQFFNFVGWLLPMAELMPIIISFIALMGFRIVVSLIKTIWDLLPIV